jgi:hypothetical protein
MALAILLFVLFIVVAMIAFFIFPPTKWVEWFYDNNEPASSEKEAKSDSQQEQTKRQP